MKTNKIRYSGLAALGCLAISHSSLFAQSGPSPHPASLDGVPLSGSSFTALSMLRQDGFLQRSSREESEMNDAAFQARGKKNGQEYSDADYPPGGKGSFDITPDYGAFSAGAVKGSTYRLPLYANFKLSDRVGLSLNIPVQYTQFRTPVGKLNVWNVDPTVGVPIKVIKRTKELPLAWTVTPHAGAGVYFADDAGNSHTYIGHGGVTSMLGYENSHFTLSMANQITFFETISRSGSYSLTKAIHQEVLQNGLKLSAPFGRRWVGDIYAIDTEFLETAYLHRYVTIGASVGYHMARMKKGSYIKAGTYTELGSGYRSIHFQFGTAWKF